MSVQGRTDGRAAPRRFTTMRLEAHIMSPGLFLRMAQQRVVISGTSRLPSISGSSMSAAGSAASMRQPRSAMRRA